MCGYVGYVNYTKDISTYNHIIKNMNNALLNRGPDEEGYFIDNHINLGHKRLIVIDPENGKQPMQFEFNNCIYTIVYNGQIYNTKELKNELLINGFTFSGHSDTEILLKSYVHWGYNVVNKLNGIFSFAIWNSKKQELFLVRDHFGIKPLYYTFSDNNFIFSSEIKAILKHPHVEAILDSKGICELFGIGPAHTPGTSVFKNIKELEPAHYGILNKNGLHIEKYWELISKEHTDSFEKTCENIKYLLDDSIKKQLVSDVPLGLMLSRWFRFKHYNRIRKQLLQI